jgi:hypothetical protein
MPGESVALAELRAAIVAEEAAQDCFLGAPGMAQGELEADPAGQAGEEPQGITGERGEMFQHCHSGAVLRMTRCA